MTEDTKAILEALDAADEALNIPQYGVDEDGGTYERRAFPINEKHRATLRALRSRIEKGREFVEAAMAMVELTLPGAGYWNALVKTKRQLERQARERLETAYRTLTEKPPEEGEK